MAGKDGGSRASGFLVAALSGYCILSPSDLEKNNEKRKL
jgi:hypothetical protein